MILPGRELINAVMLFVPDAIELNKDGKSLDLYELAYEDGSVIGGGNINIYELMHMMKEWANNSSETISSYKKHGHYYASLWWNEKRDLSGSDLLFKADTEFEAVTKACEWIQEQK